MPERHRAAMVIYTIGHSTRELGEFLALLRAHGIRRLVDVRRYPGSRRYPHFARDALAAALRADGVDYGHEPDLGGRRSGRRDSPHTAWRSPSFRAYADHMDTATFAAALARLVALGTDAPTAILCAEALPWRCHRQLIADALTARGVAVGHILDAGPAQRHALNPSAQVEDDGRLLYAGPPTLFPSRPSADAHER
jgi:uncharacterized protein (DUF488 family)